jgi:hypothetical protein
MTALASWVTPSPFGNALSEAIRDSGLSERFTWSSPSSDERFFYRLILNQLAYLLEKLADYMRERSRTLKKDAPEFENYRTILSRLRDEFEIGIYNLNYDNVAVSAWPDAFTGFRDGEFDARGIGLRREWEFIYHLHGSVHHSFPDDPPFALGLVWKDNLDSTFKNSQQPLIPNMGQEFTPIVPTTLIAGGFKLDQLLADPFQTFHAALIRHAHEADAVLIAGYGFGDVHVNRALQNRYSLSPYDASRRPPVVVLTKSSPTSRATSERQEYDLWGYQLTHTLNTRFDRENISSIESLMEQRILEKDLHGCLEIWHGGFIEVLDSLDGVITKLSR